MTGEFGVHKGSKPFQLIPSGLRWSKNPVSSMAFQAPNVRSSSIEVAGALPRGIKVACRTVVAPVQLAPACGRAAMDDEPFDSDNGGQIGQLVQAADRPSSISKEFLEPLRRQRGIARRILNIAMPEIRLDRPRVVAIVGQLVAAGVAQHVGMR
jgi:hypothetical protein